MKSSACLLTVVLAVGLSPVYAEAGDTAPTESVPSNTGSNSGQSGKRDLGGVKQSSNTVRAGSGIPVFNYEPSCKAALKAGAIQGRNDEACFRDEEAARSTLEKQWTGFTSEQKSLCDRLKNAGGMPSYVEYLTCLEIGKAASGLPKDFTDSTIPEIESKAATAKSKRTRATTRKGHRE
jgi:hypothetical protein